MQRQFECLIFKMITLLNKVYREPFETRNLLDTIFTPEKVAKITRSDIRSQKPSQHAQRIN